MQTLTDRLTRTLWSGLGGNADRTALPHFTGDGALRSTFAVTDLAAAAVATAGLAIAELVSARGGRVPSVHVDRRLASFWFSSSIRPRGWRLGAVWDPIAGDYRTADGWIRLHTNAPHHRAAAERVLGHHTDRSGLAEQVLQWSKGELEQAIVAEGGCAAEMRSLAEWRAHPQGAAVGSEPLAHTEWEATGPSTGWRVPAERPLAGIRVLDLTRVLAGPVASRFLAAYGADVLRIDPPTWNEPSVVPEVTLGKRCARLDLRNDADRATFVSLLSRADVLLHGYRPGALTGLGWNDAQRRHVRPGLIDVSLCAYGWTGPWHARRGFDSLVQMSTGIADAGQRWRGTDHPVPLPVQALDHATGYLLAAAVVRGIAHRARSGGALTARLSLARTAKLLIDAGEGHVDPPLAEESAADLAPGTEDTSWGAAGRLRVPLAVEGAPMHWALPATDLGTSQPRWLES